MFSSSLMIVFWIFLVGFLILFSVSLKKVRDQVERVRNIRSGSSDEQRIFLKRFSFQKIYSESVLDCLPPWWRVFVVQMPATFTALGIFFTFLGLVSAIGDLNVNGDSTLLIEGMQTVLNGVGTAFVSSLVGIAVSVITLFLSRQSFDDLESEITQTNHFFESKGLLSYPEKSLTQMNETSLLQYNLAKELRDYAESQDAKMGTLATDIAGMLDQALTPSIQNLTQAVDGISAGSAAVHSNALEGIMNTFLTRFEQSLGDQFTRLGETLEKTLQWHQQTEATLSKTLETLEETAEKQQLVLDSQIRALEFAERVETERNQKVTLMMERANLLSSQLGNIFNEFQAIQHSWPPLASALSQAAEASSEGAVLLARNVEKLDQNLNEFERRITMTSQEYNRLVSEIRNELAAGLQETFGKFDKSTAKIVDHLNGTYLNLNDTLDRFDKTLQNVNGRS